MRKILLIICIAFVVVCYGYPCFVLPFGEYTHTAKATVAGVDVSVTTSYKFTFKGKATVKVGDVSTEYNYKLKGNTVILSEDDEFGNADDEKIEISSMYRLGNAVNNIGMYTTIGVGVLALLLVVTIPNKNS